MICYLLYGKFKCTVNGDGRVNIDNLRFGNLQCHAIFSHVRNIRVFRGRPRGVNWMALATKSTEYTSKMSLETVARRLQWFGV